MFLTFARRKEKKNELKAPEEKKDQKLKKKK